MLTAFVAGHVCSWPRCSSSGGSALQVLAAVQLDAKATVQLDAKAKRNLQLSEPLIHPSSLDPPLRAHRGGALEPDPAGRRLEQRERGLEPFSLDGALSSCWFSLAMSCFLSGSVVVGFGNLRSARRAKKRAALRPPSSRTSVIFVSSSSRDLLVRRGRWSPSA